VRHACYRLERGDIRRPLAVKVAELVLDGHDAIAAEFGRIAVRSVKQIEIQLEVVGVVDVGRIKE